MNNRKAIIKSARPTSSRPSSNKPKPDAKGTRKKSKINTKLQK
jgi:hypothetical protein